MALDFPDNPLYGDTFSSDKKTWEWDGIAWSSIDVLVDNSVSTGYWDSTYTTVSANSGDWVSSEQLDIIVKLTQAEYDLLTPDPNTLYIITT